MAHAAFNAQDSAITPRGTFSSPTKTNKLKKKSNSYHFYDRKHRQQHHQRQHRGRNSQPFTALTVLSTSLCTFLLNQRNRGKNGFWTKATVSVSTHGCCFVYQRPRLMSNRQIVPFCQGVSLQWPWVFVYLLPWLQREMLDVCAFSAR